MGCVFFSSACLCLLLPVVRPSSSALPRRCLLYYRLLRKTNSKIPWHSCSTVHCRAVQCSVMEEKGREGKGREFRSDWNTAFETIRHTSHTYNPYDQSNQYPCPYPVRLVLTLRRSRGLWRACPPARRLQPQTQTQTRWAQDFRCNVM